VDSDIKWKTVGDVAMAAWKLGLAEECLERANDLSGLLLLHTSSGNAKGMRNVADLAREYLNSFFNNKITLASPFCDRQKQEYTLTFCLSGSVQG
jgi:hypothetical protein